MAYSWGKGRAAGTASSTPLGRWIGQERRRRINRTPGQYTRAAATSTATARRRRARPRRRGGARGRRRRPRRPPAATGRGPGARRRSAARARPRLRETRLRRWRAMGTRRVDCVNASTLKKTDAGKDRRARACRRTARPRGAARRGPLCEYDCRGDGVFMGSSKTHARPRDQP